MRIIKYIVTKGDTWQVLSFFFIAIVFLGLSSDSYVMNIVATLFMSLVFIGWFFILGLSLNENLPEKEQKSDSLFIVLCVFLILISTFSSMVPEVQISNDEAIGVMGVLIFSGFSFFYIVYFVSILYTISQEKYLENKNKLSSRQIFLSFIIFIFGVILLQPRIKKNFCRE